jgi:chaperone protein EcpD
VVANQKNEGQNVLQLAIRSRFKFIYRPAGLGNREFRALPPSREIRLTVM